MGGGPDDRQQGQTDTERTVHEAHASSLSRSVGIVPEPCGHLRSHKAESSVGRMGRKGTPQSVGWLLPQHWLRPLQRLSLPILRLLLWAVALAYLLLEAREVASQRQLTQITVFAVLVLVANFQMNLARHLPSDHEEMDPLIQASLAMFVSSLFSMLDGALDYLLGSLQGGMAPQLLPAFYLLGWGVNLLSVVLAIGSMELFLSSMRRMIKR